MLWFYQIIRFLKGNCERVLTFSYFYVIISKRKIKGLLFMSLNKVYLDYLLFDCGLSIKNIAIKLGIRQESIYTWMNGRIPTSENEDKLRGLYTEYGGKKIISVDYISYIDKLYLLRGFENDYSLSKKLGVYSKSVHDWFDGCSVKPKGRVAIDKAFNNLLEEENISLQDLVLGKYNDILSEYKEYRKNYFDARNKKRGLGKK